MQSVFYTPTEPEIRAARKAFKEHEPRDLFYRAATELVGLAIQEKTSLDVAEAVAVLLQTWNRAFYRFRPFNEHHLVEIEHAIACHRPSWTAFRQRSIESFADEDEARVKELFESFEQVLGPVGAAKCLHLLAPRFLPLWDRAIAKAYGLGLKGWGSNSERYCHFMRIAKEQCRTLSKERSIGEHCLKALDEYNYCKYTKRCI